MNNNVYAIVDIDSFDPDGYGEYMRRVSPAPKSVGARKRSARIWQVGQDPA